MLRKREPHFLGRASIGLFVPLGELARLDDVLRTPLAEIGDVREQHVTRNLHVADQLLDGGDTVVERALRVWKAEAPLPAHDGPVVHAVAREYDAYERLSVDDENAVARKHEVPDLGVPAHSVPCQD